MNRIVLECLSRMPLRTCRSMHDCMLCHLIIGNGDRYYDGGFGKRAHERCVLKELAVSCRHKEGPPA